MSNDDDDEADATIAFAVSFNFGLIVLLNKYLDFLVSLRYFIPMICSVWTLDPPGGLTIASRNFLPIFSKL